MVEPDRKSRVSGWVFLVAGVLIGAVITLAILLTRVHGESKLASVTASAPFAPPGMSVKHEKVTAGSARAESGGGGTADRLVIKRTTIRLEVKDVNAAFQAVAEIAAKHKGFITNSTIYSPGGAPVNPAKPTPEARSGPLQGMIVVKIPVERFGTAVKEMKDLGEIRSEEESAEEVTEQHIDLTARLRNLKRQEERYLEILKSAVKVEEMLKVEQQLVRIRGEIESLQAQVEYLEKTAAMATITLELIEPGSVAAPLVRWGLRDALTTAVRSFIAVFNFLIIAVGAVAPLVITGGLTWLGVRALQKRRRTDT